jgi:formyl-CoA transferase
MLVDLDLPGARSVKTIDSPIWVEGARKVKPRRAPEVGEHTEQVLREAGCSDADIAALRAAGAII